MSSATIIIKVPPVEVWQALTDPALIKQYLFGTNVTADWVVGGHVTYQGEWEGKKYEDKGVILELVPEKKLVSTYWSSMAGLPDVPENYETVTYELESVDGGTKVIISQDKGKADNWNMVLGKLKELLEK